MCKMAVLGRGSMKDRNKVCTINRRNPPLPPNCCAEETWVVTKVDYTLRFLSLSPPHAQEEELRTAHDPKYAHLHDELHVEISALAPPAEAHARTAYALAEVRKYLIPDSNDGIRQEQLRELIAEGVLPADEEAGHYGPPPHHHYGGPMMPPYHHQHGHHHHQPHHQQPPPHHPFHHPPQHHHHQHHHAGAAAAHPMINPYTRPRVIAAAAQQQMNAGGLPATLSHRSYPTTL